MRSFNPTNPRDCEAYVAGLVDTRNQAEHALRLTREHVSEGRWPSGLLALGERAWSGLERLHALALAREWLQVAEQHHRLKSAVLAYLDQVEAHLRAVADPPEATPCDTPP